MARHSDLLCSTGRALSFRLKEPAEIDDGQEALEDVLLHIQVCGSPSCRQALAEASGFSAMDIACDRPEEPDDDAYDPDDLDQRSVTMLVQDQNRSSADEEEERDAGRILLRGSSSRHPASSRRRT